MYKIAALVSMLLLAACASTLPRLNQPFVLHAGETMRVEPDGFEITLRSVSDDSGCMTPTDCPEMMFNGSIVVHLGDKANLIQTGAILKGGSVLALDLDGYAFHLTDVRRNARNLIEATFVVVGKANSHTKSNETGGGTRAFDYTKIGATGTVLAIQDQSWTYDVSNYDNGSEAAGTTWSCVKDNITNLTWEGKTKTSPAGLRDWTSTYTWHNSTGANDGGNAGGVGTNTCGGTLSDYSNQCNTQNYVAAVNAAALCGYTNWRMPTYRELLTLVSRSTLKNLSIEASYFPNTQPSHFWSASSSVANPAEAWVVYFDAGHFGTDGKADFAFHARLVHGAVIGSYSE